MGEYSRDSSSQRSGKEHHFRFGDILTGVLLSLQLLLDKPVSKRVKKTRSGRERIDFSKPLLILLYTHVFMGKKYCGFAAERIFGRSCPSKNRCQWSCNLRDTAQADALIFHAYDIQYYHDSLPSRSETKANAIWILWSDEPPSMVDYALLKPHRFNWTMSYKLNSEVSLASYGLFSRRTQPLSNEDYNQWINDEFSRRTNGALWFVSNCETKQRLDYFHQLRRQSTLLVEGYGRCVDNYPMHWCSAGTPCEQEYMSQFKFYLSFESTTCRDYITEKFYKALYHHLIPIIHGPARADYERLAPPNSFLHVDDFDKNVTRLAQRLQEIHSDRQLFSSYHQWRKTLEVIIDRKALERIRMCELCQRLNQVKQGETTYYEDVEEFYRESC